MAKDGGIVTKKPEAASIKRGKGSKPRKLKISAQTQDIKGSSIHARVQDSSKPDYCVQLVNFESDHHTSANAKTSRFYQERAFVAEIVSNGNLRENMCIEKEKEQNHCSHVDHYLPNKALSIVETSIEAGGDTSQWQS